MSSRFDPWPVELDGLLKKNYEKSYSELEMLLKKTKRSIKHRIAKLGLHRSERRRWVDSEIDVLKSNIGFSPKDFVENGLVDRSESQIAIQLRKVRGSALRGFEISECIDDAYLLGAICSDCLVDKRGIELSQSIKDELFVLEVQRILQNHSLKVSIRKYNKYSQTGSMNEYWYLFAGGKSILKTLATEKGILVNNVRGPDSEWIEFLDEKFSWIWKEEFFWYFLGGLFDGDGCGSKGKPSIAIAPKNSALRISEEIRKRGFDTVDDGVSVSIRGGEIEYVRFFSLLKNVLSRKSEMRLSRKNGERVMVQRVLQDGVQAVSQHVVKSLFEREHYLGTIPGGSSCYAVIEGGEVVAAAAFKRVVEKKFGLSALELRRFVTARHEPNFASKSLAAICFVAKNDFVDCQVVVSFADISQGHVGTIYKAVGGVLVGNTGPSVKVIADNGREFGGRFLAQSILAANVDVSKCSIRVVDGKLKYFLRLNMTIDEFKKLKLTE